MVKLITLTGPSGSGKTTLSKKLFKPENTLVSFTTRSPRVGEVDGVDYYFVTNENVKEMKDNNQLAEHIIYDGNQYGYTKDEFTEKLSLGDAIAVVNIDGYKSFKEISELKINGKFISDILYPIFIDASYDTILEHMTERIDSPEKIKDRLSLYDDEKANKEFFIKEKAYIFDIDGLSIEDSIEVLTEVIKKKD